MYKLRTQFKWVEKGHTSLQQRRNTMWVSRLQSCSGSGFSISTLQPPATFARNSRARTERGSASWGRLPGRSCWVWYHTQNGNSVESRVESWQCSAILTHLLCNFTHQGHWHCSLSFFLFSWNLFLVQTIRWLQHITLLPIGHKWHEAEIWTTAPGKAYSFLVLSTNTRDKILISGLCLRKPFHRQEFLYSFCALRCLKPLAHPLRFTRVSLTLFPTSLIRRQAASLLPSAWSACSNLPTHPTGKHVQAVTWPSDSFLCKVCSFTLLCWTPEKHLSIPIGLSLPYLLADLLLQRVSSFHQRLMAEAHQQCTTAEPQHHQLLPIN